MSIEVGDFVRAAPGDNPYGFTGVVTMLHRNHDGRLNGIVRVRITEPSDRAGRETDVGAVACTKLPKPTR